MQMVEMMANNQFVIQHKDRRIFQSYATIIAVIDTKAHKTLIDERKYSQTTSKYLNRFLNDFDYYTANEREYVDNDTLVDYIFNK